MVYLASTSPKTPRAMLLGLFAALVPASSLGVHGLGNHTRTTDSVTFDSFIELHGRAYKRGSEEYLRRAPLFEAHAKEVRRHNSNPNRLWHAKVTHLADRTPTELSMLRGYRRKSASAGSTDGGASQASFLQSRTETHTADTGKIPNDWSWVGRLKAMSNIRDQGECGSCWAFAVATVLRAHSELYQQDRTFSVQQIVSCTPNPEHCGGEGGCQGATSELAMDYVTKASMLTEEAMEYQGKDQKCPKGSSLPKPSFVSVLRGSLHLGSGESVSPAAAFGMTSWRKLPENKHGSLLMSVFEDGPVAVSLSAGASWNHYDMGVMDSCEKEAVVNHAVVLVGFGQVREHLGTVNYWQIQNSWGPNWGERGHIRLLRHKGAEEDQYCGWDSHPEQGTGCTGGPSQVWVCGSCGILYDSVVPMFTRTPKGLTAKQNMQLADGASAGDDDDDVMERADSMLQLSSIPRAGGEESPDRSDLMLQMASVHRPVGESRPE